MIEYSDESSEGCCDVDSVREDTEVGDELNESSLRAMLSPWVMVSVLGRETKRPYALGWVFQASVEEFSV
jgi:hypothetical protein